MQTRRRFLRDTILAAASLPLAAPLSRSSETTTLTILHTNDVHSRIDPFPAGSRYAGRGGAARRMEAIEAVRAEQDHVLLLDAGDIFQGTPYFNVYGGEVEFKLMSAMGYDAATLGNHDFDAGVDGLLRQMPHADFTFVNANYDLSDSPLRDHVRPYRIVEKGPLRIGITGVGIELDGLVPDDLFRGVRYRDPVGPVNEIAGHLRSAERCDLVICLSHLGYAYESDRISDIRLARMSEHIDIILGGHTHTFLDEPTIETNRMGEAVSINQVGWAGLVLGRLDVSFDHMKRRRSTRNLSSNISEKST